MLRPQGVVVVPTVGRKAKEEVDEGREEPEECMIGALHVVRVVVHVVVGFGFCLSAAAGRVMSELQGEGGVGSFGDRDFRFADEGEYLACRSQMRTLARCAM